MTSYRGACLSLPDVLLCLLCLADGWNRAAMSLFINSDMKYLFPSFYFQLDGAFGSEVSLSIWSDYVFFPLHSANICLLIGGLHLCTFKVVTDKGHSRRGAAETNPTRNHEGAGFQSLASLSGLRIEHCCELWCRSQTWLGSRIAVAVV